MSGPHDHEPCDDEASLGAPLELALRRQPLSPVALDRVRCAVEAELKESVRRRALTRQWYRVAGLAACLAMLAVLAGYVFRPADSDVLVGSIAQGDGDGLQIHDGFFSTRVGVPGAQLHAGERWEATGATVIDLAGGGQMRLARNTVIEASEGNHFSLRAGRAYLDFPARAAHFVLHTARGYVEHLGTQFEVMSSGDDLRIRVREGSVQLHTPEGTEVTRAGNELFVPETGARERRRIPTYGGEWGWVEAIAPRYDIEDRSVADFLSWVARETGRHVDFVDDRSREVAVQTRLHGSIRKLEPLEALTRVLETTSLRAELHEDAIRVNSGT
jgi:ferric-dicitrate binding protein FerR (iron transport regulator)